MRAVAFAAVLFLLLGNFTVKQQFIGQNKNRKGNICFYICISIIIFAIYKGKQSIGEKQAIQI